MFNVTFYHESTPESKMNILKPKEGINYLVSATLDKQEDSIDALNTSVSHAIFVDNPSFEFESYKIIAEVFNTKTQKWEFRGRVLPTESGMSDNGSFNHSVTFEGGLSFLKDTMQVYGFHFQLSPAELLPIIINRHNEEVASEPHKQITLGTIDVPIDEIPQDEEYNEELKYFKTWEDKTTYDTLMEDMIGKYGGHFVVDYTETAIVLNYLKDPGVLTETKIELGHNLKNIQYKVDPSEVITRLKPLGSTSETANGDELRLTIADVNNGSPYIDIPILQNIYGIITKSVDFDAYTPVTLKEKADKWVEEQYNKVAKVSISLSALDLYEIGLDSSTFELYNLHRTVFPPFKIDKNLKIVGITKDLLNPQNKDITIGELPLTLSDVQSKALNDVEKVVSLESGTSPLNSQLKVLSKAIKNVSTVTDGVDLPTKNGLIKDVVVAPEGIKVNENLIELGTDPGSPSEVIIYDGVAYVRNLNFDKMQGGNIVVGGSVQVPDTSQPMVEVTREDGTTEMEYPMVTKVYENATILRYNNNGEAVVRIDENGNRFDTASIESLYVGGIVEGSVATSRSVENKTFYIDVNPTTAVEEDFTTYDGSTLDKAMDYKRMPFVLPDVLNHTYTFYVKPHDAGNGRELPTDHIQFVGIMGGGNIVIDLNQQIAAWTCNFSKCACDCIIRNGTILYNPESTNISYSIQNYGSRNLEVFNLYLQSFRYPTSEESYDGIRGWYDGFTYVYDCYSEGYRDSALFDYGHTAHLKNNTGEANRNGTSSYHGATVSLQGTSFSSLVSGRSAFSYYGGEIRKWTDVTFPNEPESGDSSVVTTKPTTSTDPKTRTWTATSANNYYGSFWSTNYWKGRVVSGKWGTLASQSGIWLFSTDMRNTLKDKTIKKVVVSIARQSGYGIAGAITTNLRLHTYTSYPSGSPSMSSVNKAISIYPGTRKSVDVTSTFASLLANGAYYGFGLRSAYDQAHYGAFSPTFSVTVTYV